MSDVSLQGAQPAKKAGAKKAKQPKRRAPQKVTASAPPDDEQQVQAQTEAEARAAAAESVDSRGFSVVPDDFTGQQVPNEPANPYAPTGWRKRQHAEFDLEMPSGQLCRIRRLERDDLLRMDLMKYLDTFTPMLLEDSMSDEDRQVQMTETVKENPEALQKMLKAIDKVVLACTVKPQITEDELKVNYGGPHDWENPNFVATVHLDDIDTFERMYIFGAAFGRDMDDLKSVLQQTEGVADLAT